MRGAHVLVHPDGPVGKHLQLALEERRLRTETDAQDGQVRVELAVRRDDLGDLALYVYIKSILYVM